ISGVRETSRGTRARQGTSHLGAIAGSCRCSDAVRTKTRRWLMHRRGFWPRSMQSSAANFHRVLPTSSCARGALTARAAGRTISARSDGLPFEQTVPDEPALPDEAARRRAVDPAHHVVLEASGGTQQTTVPAERCLNLRRSGVDPSNILAIPSTRKAASEMRSRILAELRIRADSSTADRQLWQGIRDRSADISISTIDAFCLSLLH